MSGTNMNDELSEYLLNLVLSSTYIAFKEFRVIHNLIILVLLERVFFRIGSADTDTQLSSCINNFLVPVLQKLSSPHESVRNKVCIW